MIAKKMAPMIKGHSSLPPTPLPKLGTKKSTLRRPIGGLPSDMTKSFATRVKAIARKSAPYSTSIVIPIRMQKDRYRLVEHPENKLLRCCPLYHPFKTKYTIVTDDPKLSYNATTDHVAIIKESSDIDDAYKLLMKMRKKR